MLIIDPWLLDLGTQGKEQAYVAALIGRCQFRVSKRLGHLINLGGAAERMRITEAARAGRVTREAVFCLRCGAGALLDSWVSDDILAEAGGVYEIPEGMTPLQMTAVAYRVPCEGTRVMRVAGAMLKKYLDDRGVNP